MSKTNPMKLIDIEIVVYYAKPDEDKYFIKVIFVGLGMYINSFSVMPSENNNEYAVYPPSHRQMDKRTGGFKWTPTVDLEKEHPLRLLIEQRAIEAVGQYKLDNPDRVKKIAKKSAFNNKPKRNTGYF